MNIICTIFLIYLHNFYIKFTQYLFYICKTFDKYLNSICTIFIKYIFVFTQYCAILDFLYRKLLLNFMHVNFFLLWRLTCYNMSVEYSNLLRSTSNQPHIKIYWPQYTALGEIQSRGLSGYTHNNSQDTHIIIVRIQT